MLYSDSQQSAIISARAIFARLRSGNFTKSDKMSGLEGMESGIRTLLSDGRLGLSVLDPEGKKNNEQMDAELRAAVAHIKIDREWESYERLRKGALTYDEQVLGGYVVLASKINDGLLRINIEDSALDDDHREKRKEMQENTYELAKEFHIAKALEDFACLLNGDKARYSSFRYMVMAIRGNLEVAGVDASELDSSGKKSVEDMETELAGAIFRATGKNEAELMAEGKSRVPTKGKGGNSPSR